MYVSIFRKIHWLSDCEDFNKWTTDVVVATSPGSASKVTCLTCLDHLESLGNK